MRDRDAIKAAYVVVGGKRLRAAVSYRRISDDREGLEEGVSRQSEDLATLAEREGLHIVADYCDDDRGASTRSRKVRPGWDDMIARTRAGDFDGHVIAAYSTSRLTRRPRENEDLIELAELHGIEYAYCKSPAFDLNTAAGRQVARILAATDAATAEYTSELVQRAALGRAEQGRPNGGQRAYGFACSCRVPENDRQHPHPGEEQIRAEVAIVKEIANRVIDGEHTRGIARDLRARGVPTARGGQWCARVVKELILRAANVGWVDYRGEILRTEVAGRQEPVKAQADGILDLEVWRTATAVLTHPDRGVFHGQTPTSLLAGIAACHCGGRIRSGARGTYVGGECSHLKRARTRLDGRGVDDVVNRYVVMVLGREGVTTHGQAGPAVDNRDAMAVLRRQLELLEDRLADELLTPAGYRRQRDRKLAQLADLEREELVSRAPAVMTGVTVESWVSLPLERRRAVVKHLCAVRLVPYGPEDRSGAGVEITPT